MNKQASVRFGAFEKERERERNPTDKHTIILNGVGYLDRTGHTPGMMLLFARRSAAVPNDLLEGKCG